MTITNSLVVYACADEFMEERTRGGVELPCREVRVKKRDLAATAMAAAFVGLAQAGALRPYVGTRRALLGLRKRSVVFVELLVGSASFGGLEGRLLASLSDSQDANSVGDIIERLLPTSGDPWRDVIALIEEEMLDEGYFSEGERKKKMAEFFLGKRLVPDCERFAAIEERVPAVRQALDAFRQTDGVLCEQLTKDIRNGIRAQQDVDAGLD